MSEFKSLSDAVIKGDINTATAETKKAVDGGAKIQDIIDNGLIAAMDEVGDRFSKGQMFVPQMLRSAKTMQECMILLKPLFQEGDITSKGKVLIGTVKGDLHDIGKNLVGMMFRFYILSLSNQPLIVLLTTRHHLNRSFSYLIALYLKL